MKKIILSALLATTLVLAGCNKEPQNKKIDPNPLINEFIKTTNVSEVPNLPIREDWSYQVDAENKVFTLSLSSLDAPTIETNFLSSVEAADWACINESKDYLLEDVGYAYIDDIEEPEVLLLFKASSDQFTLKVKLDFVYEPAVDINLVIAEYVKIAISLSQNFLRVQNITQLNLQKIANLENAYLLVQRKMMH